MYNEAVPAAVLNYMNKIKGLKNIKNLRTSLRTSAQHHDEYELYNELAKLAWEKSRLNREKGNWQEKTDQVDERLREIEKLEGPLQGQVAAKGNRISNNQRAGQDAGNERREVVIKY